MTALLFALVLAQARVGEVAWPWFVDAPALDEHTAPCVIGPKRVRPGDPPGRTSLIPELLRSVEAL